MSRIIDTAVLNRSQLNGFIPNGASTVGIAAESASFTDGDSRVLDMVMALSESVTAPDSVAKTFGVVLADGIRTQDWTNLRTTNLTRFTGE